MNRFIKTSLWLLLAGAVVSGVLIAAVVQWAAPFDGATLSINGEHFRFTQLQGAEWLLAIGAVLLAMVVVMLVVPFAVIVPLLFAAFGIAIALFAVVGMATLLLSPLLLLAWVVWRLTRSAPAAPRPGATMGA